MPNPFIENGRLRIPIDTEPKYRWWEKEGQNVWTTLEELGVPEEQRRSYFRTYWLEHALHNAKYIAIEIQLKPNGSPDVTITQDVTPPPDAIPFEAARQRIKGA